MFLLSADYLYLFFYHVLTLCLLPIPVLCRVLTDSLLTTITCSLPCFLLILCWIPIAILCYVLADFLLTTITCSLPCSCWFSADYLYLFFAMFLLSADYVYLFFAMFLPILCWLPIPVLCHVLTDSLLTTYTCSLPCSYWLSADCLYLLLAVIVLIVDYFYSQHSCWLCADYLHIWHSRHLQILCVRLPVSTLLRFSADSVFDCHYLLFSALLSILRLPCRLPLLWLWVGCVKLHVLVGGAYLSYLHLSSLFVVWRGLATNTTLEY